jgi:hypothetical protein
VKRLWRDHGLSITIAVVFLVAWMLQTLLGWGEFAAEQRSLGQEPQVLGPDGYVWSWGRATFENWQSEFLQVFAFIVLTTFLIHRHSHESPDTDYQTEASLRRIEARLIALEGSARGAKGPAATDIDITPAQVEQEHLREIKRRWHWAYLIGVMGLGFALTIILLVALHGALGF